MFTFHHYLHILPVVTFGERLDKSASNETVSCFYLWHETTSLKIPVEGMQADTRMHGVALTPTPFRFQPETFHFFVSHRSSPCLKLGSYLWEVRLYLLAPFRFSISFSLRSSSFFFFFFFFWSDSQEELPLFSFTGVQLSKITKLQFASVWYRNIE